MGITGEKKMDDSISEAQTQDRRTTGGSSFIERSFNKHSWIGCMCLQSVMFTDAALNYSLFFSI